MEKPRSEAIERASAMPPRRFGGFFMAQPASLETDIWESREELDEERKTAESG